MMELANVFRGDFEKRQGWGWHDLEAWNTFLTTIRSINQISRDIKAEGRDQERLRRRRQ